MHNYADSLFGKLNAKVVTRLIPFVVLGCISWKSVHVPERGRCDAEAGTNAAASR